MKLPWNRRRRPFADGTIELVYEACQVDFDQAGGIRIHSPEREHAVFLDGDGVTRHERSADMKPLTMSAAALARNAQFESLVTHWIVSDTPVTVTHDAYVPDTDTEPVVHQATRITDGRVTVTFTYPTPRPEGHL